MEMNKDHTFGWIVLLITIGIFATVIGFLARESINAALTLIWAPVAIAGTYLLGKRAGRNE
ncbi:hypothetical protein [Enterococcus sp. 2201sp1_2201st1_B8_2201SCRN_220225]|uniref:hypothetical protein n=1 Tax=unclassified Enterococcus TaxID=2608891 RepID=UPI0034A55F49